MTTTLIISAVLFSLILIGRSIFQSGIKHENEELTSPAETLHKQRQECYLLKHRN